MTQALSRHERGIQVQLLKALQGYLEGLQYDGEGQDSEWVSGHGQALSSVEWWAREMIQELENT